MAAGRTRSTRRLRSWIVEQVGSGKYPGLVWDDAAKTMFRIPWKHAGKQDFRKDEDAAIFKAWAEFKGKLTDSGQDSPASWKTRLRCALNKSPEFMEMLERAQLDISEPYKVYRLVPLSEQGVVVPEKKKCRVKAMKRPRRKRRRSSSSESESSDVEPLKQIKEEEVTSQLLVDDILPWSEIHVQMEEPAQPPAAAAMHLVDEIQLDVRIEESVAVPAADHMSFSVAVHYLGREVLRREIQNSDVRIQYLPSSPAAPAMAAVMTGRFPRIPLPEPASALPAGPELQALSTLLPFMVRGVALTSTPLGVYGTRFCQGRVFWAGPHESTPGPHKMERCLEPVLLFCKDTFRRQLEQYRLNGGEPPQSAITLCFGEELSKADDPSRKLIIVKICFPWAQQQVYNTQSIFSSINMLHSLASESPLGEITLNLVSVPVEDSQTASCGGGSFQNKRQLTLSE